MNTNHVQNNDRSYFISDTYNTIFFYLISCQCSRYWCNACIHKSIQFSHTDVNKNLSPIISCFSFFPTTKETQKTCTTFYIVHEKKKHTYLYKYYFFHQAASWEQELKTKILKASFKVERYEWQHQNNNEKKIPKQIKARETDRLMNSQTDTQIVHLSLISRWRIVYNRLYP